MIIKAEKDQLLTRADEMVALAGGPGFAQARFNELVAEFQTATGVNRERARHWVAKAIRRARNPKRKEDAMSHKHKWSQEQMVDFNRAERVYESYCSCGATKTVIKPVEASQPTRWKITRDDGTIERQG